MRGKILPFVALLWFAATPLSSAAQAVLPQAFGGWTASGAGTKVPAAQIEQIANAQVPNAPAVGAQPANGRNNLAAILREYGITSAERRGYGNGAQSATVTLYEMTDPSAAFGAFTFIRDPQTTPLPLGDTVAYSSATRDHVWFVVGNLVLDISGENPPGKARPADTDLKALAAGIASRADHRPYPIIQGFLPLEGLAPGSDRYVVGQGSTISVPAKLRLIPGSEKYVLGPLALAQAFPAGPASLHDWLGFSHSAEAIVARYQLGGDEKGQEATVLVALYPTQQVAAAEYNVISNALALNADTNPANAHGAPAQSNGQSGTPSAVFGNRSSALIALITGVESRQEANNLLSQIHYASDVTWNEPPYEATDPPFSTMIVGIFLDTGSLMALAVAAGLGFGGFRLLVKVLFPGKIFDTEARVEILQLGLSSKPIRSDDFYKLSSG